MGYTMEDYAAYEGLSPQEWKGYATKPSLVEKIEYPMTKQGQCGFMENFLSRVWNVPGNFSAIHRRGRSLWQRMG